MLPWTSNGAKISRQTRKIKSKWQAFTKTNLSSQYLLQSVVRLFGLLEEHCNYKRPPSNSHGLWQRSLRLHICHWRHHFQYTSRSWEGSFLGLALKGRKCYLMIIKLHQTRFPVSFWHKLREQQISLHKTLSIGRKPERHTETKKATTWFYPHAACNIIGNFSLQAGTTWESPVWFSGTM